MACPLKKRIRSTDSRVTKSYRNVGYSGSTTWDVYQNHSLGGVKTITDTVINRDVPRPPACSDHVYKNMFKSVDISTTSETSNEDETATTIHFRSASGTYASGTVDGGYFLYTNRDNLAYYDNAGLDVPVQPIADAFKRCVPSLKDAKVTGINLYTVVLELADLKKTFARSVWRLKKHLLTDAAEKNLLINFGVLPLISDITAVWDILHKLESYIDEWNKAAAAGLIWDRHERVYWEGVETLSPIPAAYASVAALGTITPSDFSVTSETRVHLYYRPKPITAKMRRRILKHAYGLDRPLVGIWNGLPLTFIIDYFSNVGDCIEAFDEALPNLFGYEFVDAGMSTKVVSSGDLTISWEEDPAYSGTIYQMWGPTTVHRSSDIYQRTKIPYKVFFDFLASKDAIDLAFGWRRGIRQAGYLASIAYLASKRR